MIKKIIVSAIFLLLSFDVIADCYSDCNPVTDCWINKYVFPNCSLCPPGPHYNVGDPFGNCGVVFYTYDGGAHGLVVSSVDVFDACRAQCAGATGSILGDIISGLGEGGVGSGVSNTIAILATCHTFGCAASRSAKYNGCLFGDWYLPSLWELYQLYLVRNYPNINITTGIYWSSTEYDANEVYALDFSNGNISMDSKTTIHKVRAIRRF